MKFSLVSDVHLEFAPMTLPGGDVLLLAGDIIVADFLRKERTDKQSVRLKERAYTFFHEECAKYNKVFYIAGNHEHYHGYIENSAEILKTFLEGTNVRFLQNETVDLGDVVLFGATMWTNMNNSGPMAIHVAKYGMNDFAGQIYHNDGKLKWTPEDSIVDHENTLSKLQQALFVNKGRKFLVMTHHTPSFKSIHPKYGNDPLNYAYSSDLSELILNNENIVAWVHGHTHTDFDYPIGNCRVMCNPRGYANPQTPNEQENDSFNLNFTFEV